MQLRLSLPRIQCFITTDTVFCFTVLWYAVHYQCRCTRVCSNSKGYARSYCGGFVSREIAKEFPFFPFLFPLSSPLTAFVGHHRHGRSWSVTLRIEHLQGNEILREGLQVVDTVILKRENKKRYRFSCPLFNNEHAVKARDNILLDLRRRQDHEYKCLSFLRPLFRVVGILCDIRGTRRVWCRDSAASTPGK